jgi:hypothetical protein
MPMLDVDAVPICAAHGILNLAEAVRFELTDSFPSPVFKTGAIDHSATLPSPQF